MNLRVDVYFHGTDTVSASLQRIEETMSALSDKVTELTTTVTAETTVEQAAITLLQGLTATIADLKNQLQNSGDVTAAVAALNDLENTINARKQALADAITANTPAA